MMPPVTLDAQLQRGLNAQRSEHEVLQQKEFRIGNNFWPNGYQRHQQQTHSHGLTEAVQILTKCEEERPATALAARHSINAGNIELATERQDWLDLEHIFEAGQP